MGKPRRAVKPKCTAAALPRAYQPNKAQLEEVMKVDVPGNTLDESTDNAPQAFLEPSNIVHRDF